jgi:Na+/H+ antiporter
MLHSTEFIIVFALSIILLGGALTRHFSNYIRLPFTLSMLLLGFIAGLILQHIITAESALNFLYLPHDKPFISSNLIIFVFLPALIFEAAFTMDAHVVKKSLKVIALLAGPALLLNTVLMAAFMIWLTPIGWGWPLALLFGALISATDPVAVTAILRELGLSKNLVTIIEGESLFNDGTSVVVFTLLLSIITGATVDITAISVIAHFAKVILGGIVIGTVLSWLIASWIGRVFNDPIVEITLTLLIGYFAMIIAEGFFHVSGVIAVVVAGLWMAERGRMRISPEVRHFLRKFWEMLAYIANSAIFFLVGITVATQMDRAEFSDFFLIALTYVGMTSIRFLVMTLMHFLFKRVGHMLPPSHSFIIGWSGLRGAVSLALILIVTTQESIPIHLRTKLFIVGSGVVFLSILINGSTFRSILIWLDMNRPPLPERITALMAKSSVLSNTYAYIQKLSRMPQLHAVTWNDIRVNLHARQMSVKKKIHAMKQELESKHQYNSLQGYWIQILSIEREAYWQPFHQGILDGRAVHTLTHEIDLHLDRLSQGIISPPSKRIPKLTKFTLWLGRFLRKHTFLNKYINIIEFDHISQLYNIARGEEIAANAVLEKLHTIQWFDETIKENITSTYLSYLHRSKDIIEEIRQVFPEITRSIETILANRIALNKEREEYSHLLSQGIIEEKAALYAINKIEKRMKALQYTSKKAILPTTEDFLREIPLFQQWPEEDRELIAKKSQEIFLSRGEILFEENEINNSLYIIARGAIHITKKKEDRNIVVAALGCGDILGEMALLTNKPRSASAVAATSVALIKITKDIFEEMIKYHPVLLHSTWTTFGRHALDNFITSNKLFPYMKENKRREWMEQSHFEECEESRPQILPANIEWIFIITGTVTVNGTEHTGPSLSSLDRSSSVTAVDAARILWLPSFSSYECAL